MLRKNPYLVTDNGPSFMARVFRQHIAGGWNHVRISYRTPQQLGLLERFHQTLKTEEVYWRLYDSPAHARECLEQFRERYNHERPHWALVPLTGGDPVVPQEVYVYGVAVGLPRWQGWAIAAQKKMRELTEGHHFPLPGNGSQLAAPTGIEILTQNDGFRVQ